MNMKKAALWLTLVMIGSFAIAFTLMGGFPGGGLWFHTSSGGNGYSRTIDHSVSYDAKDYTAIDIGTTSSNVELIPTDGEEIEFHFYGEASARDEDALPKLVVKPSGDKLIARIEYPRLINIGINFSRSSLDVRIPRDIMDKIEVKSASGSITAEDFTTKTFSAESLSGKLVLKRLQVEEGRVKTISGGIRLENYIGELRAESTSGRVYAQLDALDGDVDISNISGLIELYLPGEAEFEIKAHSVSGSITNNFLAAMENSPGSRRMEAKIGNGEYDIDLSSVSGGIAVTQE